MDDIAVLRVNNLTIKHVETSLLCFKSWKLSFMAQMKKENKKTCESQAGCESQTIYLTRGRIL